MNPYPFVLEAVREHCKSEFRKHDVPAPRFTNPQGILVRHDESQEESKNVLYIYVKEGGIAS